MDEDEATRIFMELHECVYAPLLRYATHAAGSLELAEEVVQETFTRLYRHLRRGGRIQNPKAWIFSITRREIGKKLREARAFPAAAGQADRVAAPSGETRDALEADELTRLLSVLSAREAEVVLLRLGNLKYREIGKELGIGVKSVGTLLARALVKLRRVTAGQPVRATIRSHVGKERPETLQ